MSHCNMSESIAGASLVVCRWTLVYSPSSEAASVPNLIGHTLNFSGNIYAYIDRYQQQRRLRPRPRRRAASFTPKTITSGEWQLFTVLADRQALGQAHSGSAVTHWQAASGPEAASAFGVTATGTARVKFKFRRPTARSSRRRPAARRSGHHIQPGLAIDRGRSGWRTVRG